MTRHFLTLFDLTPREIYRLLNQALQFKKKRGKRAHPQPLKGKTLAMIFDKSSTRTRVSFEVAMTELGGHVISLHSQEMQLGRGESYADTARVLSRYVQALVLRTFSQANLEELAQYASIPVINGLSDQWHPVQVLADLMTLFEKKKDLKKLKIAWVGDGNNMAHTWAQASMLLQFDLRIACPVGYGLHDSFLKEAQKYAQISFYDRPEEAVKGVDVINTDTWFSMGQGVAEEKRQAFAPFQVNEKLLSYARPQVRVLHCLPAHRGEEITDAVMDGPHSSVFDEAENRLHVQKALLVALIQ